MSEHPTDPLANLPAAGDRQGRPGHDQALDRANAIRLLTLRASGLTYEQIAEQVGYSDASGARHALLRALDRHEAENVTQLRALENIRLDARERVLRSIDGDRNATPEQKIAAVNAGVRLSARRARMNGLDAPQQLVVSSGAVAQVEDALTALEELVLGEDGVYAVEPDPSGESSSPPRDPDPTS